MSAELLRRASVRLRDRAVALPGTMGGAWFTRSDRVIADDGTDVGMLVLEPYNPTDDPPVMAFVALMDPPVARALANLLEIEAQHADVSEGACCAELRDSRLALARAILREEQ